MRRFLIILILMSIAASAAWWLVPARGESIELESAEVTRGDLENTLALTGTVVNDYTVRLTALLDGEITSIRAREGDTVAAGEVLATLDDAPPRAVLDKATADLELRRYELELATLRHDRVSRMTRSGGESTQTLDDTLLEMRRAQAAERVAIADLELAELQLRNASVRAPYAGIVIEQAVETGQWVEAGTPLFTLVAEAGRAIEAEADAGDFAQLAIAQPVTLAVAAMPDDTWASEIVRISESVSTGDSATGNTFTLRIALGDNAPHLLLGQQVDVDVATARRENAMQLPLEAVIESDDGTTSVWIDDGGVARSRTVTLGLKTIDRAEVIGGLEVGDRVLLPAGASVIEGAAVDAAKDS